MPTLEGVPEPILIIGIGWPCGLLPLPRPAGLPAPPERRCSTIDPSTSADAPQSHASQLAARANVKVRPPKSGSPAAVQPQLLGGAPAAQSSVADGAMKERPVHRLQVRQQGGDLGEERVGKDSCDFFLANAARVANQLADVHIEGAGEPLQRTQCRNRFAVFNFRDIGSRHLHPPGQLPLAQVARLANIAHLPCYLQPGLS